MAYSIRSSRCKTVIKNLYKELDTELEVIYPYAKKQAHEERKLQLTEKYQ